MRPTKSDCGICGGVCRIGITLKTHAISKLVDVFCNDICPFEIVSVSLTNPYEIVTSSALLVHPRNN